MKKKMPDTFSNRRFRELVDEYIQGDIDRELIVKFYVDDKTIDELVNMYHMSESTVNRKVHKGGHKIFRMMEHEILELERLMTRQ